MKKDGRFLIGLVGVAALVTWLIWTGVNSSMVYYMTPTELLAKVEAEPAFHNVAVKVGGKVVPGSYKGSTNNLEHSFLVRDMADEDATFPVEYSDILPDTFTDDVEVVVEGRFREDGVFEADLVLTKCGSRYEAAPEELAADALGGEATGG